MSFPHPGSIGLLVMGLGTAYLTLSAPLGLVLAVALLLCSMVLKPRSATVIAAESRRIERVFLVVVGVTTLWLSVIHLTQNGLNQGVGELIERIAPYLGRISVIFASAVLLAKMYSRDEVFAIGVSLRLPVPILFVCLRALFLVPSVSARYAELLHAYRLRGFRLGSLTSRVVALTRILPAAILSLLSESVDTSIALQSKALFSTGEKSSILEVRWSTRDSIVAAIGGLILVASVAFAQALK